MVESDEAWIDELRSSYKSGAHNQFILHGNVYDSFFIRSEEKLLGLVPFISEEILSGFDAILTYDLAKGVRIRKGGDDLAKVTNRPVSSEETVRSPAAALRELDRLLLSAVNVARIRGGSPCKVAVVIEDAHLVVPFSGGRSRDHELSRLALTLRNWASDGALREHPLATFLTCENFSDLHPLVSRNPRSHTVEVPLPGPNLIGEALIAYRKRFPKAFGKEPEKQLAEQLSGVALVSVEEAVRMANLSERPIEGADVAELKKSLIENDARDLIEFIPPSKNFSNMAGSEAIKKWVSKDLQNWREGRLRAVPKGYLLCGPVGTGKTFLAECMAGEAGVPTVALKNFRERWVGTSEGNLEKVFRILRALGRCMVFVDEADQALGRRVSEGDGGLSGRLYSMIAKEMGKNENRGRIVWILASSRPDLIEVDLKRPGRVDVKIPILPTSTTAESMELIRALLRRNDLVLSDEEARSLEENAPLLMTAGAAEALAAKVMRLQVTSERKTAEVLSEMLKNYQPSVPKAVIEFQIDLAVREATDIELVPEYFQNRRNTKPHTEIES
ncbi:MAG: hypothetical protein CMI26_05070 [Opitutae bacterium]|nr:hypothetical protein [Opitutae bacterium]